jgi:mannose-6-phosphate isomerase-like protein (cupin superfamily)
MKRIALSDIEAVAVRHNPRIHKKMLLAPGELPPLVQFSQAVFPPGESVEPHRHVSMHEVFFIQRGTGSITVEGMEHEVGPGSCLLVEAGERHALRNTGDEPLLLLFFGLEEAAADDN